MSLGLAITDHPVTRLLAGNCNSRFKLRNNNQQRETVMIPRLKVICILLVFAISWSGTAAAWGEKRRLKEANALFQERCKKAGEFIYRTADDVDGILLLKIRETTNFGDQYKMDDPYGHDSTGIDYFKGFFLDAALVANSHASAELKERIRQMNNGFLYVDSIDPVDGKRYRYTGRIEEPWQTDKKYLKGYQRFVLDRAEAPAPAPRYGVTFDDISTREDRDHWIAGSALRVIDLKSNTVMAERIGYMVDPQQGNTSGGRSPWLLAASYACPGFGPSNARDPGAAYQQDQTRQFVVKVLHPVVGQ